MKLLFKILFGFQDLVISDSSKSRSMQKVMQCKLGINLVQIFAIIFRSLEEFCRSFKPIGYPRVLISGSGSFGFLKS